MGSAILIIDDEVKLRELLGKILSLEGFEIVEVGDCKAGLKKLDMQIFPLVLCDVKLPDGNGVDMVAKIKTKSPETEVILLTAYGNIHDGVQAMKNGAFDYLVKGDDNNKIVPLVNKAFEKAQLQLKVKELQTRLPGETTFESIIGKSLVIKQAISLAEKVAPTDANVLLTGETGTGKEVFAQAIHNASLRNGNGFVALNCSSFSKENLESELFGYKVGAFTGAVKDKKGLIEEANKGTLFLDELGEMPIELQAKLLRVLESGEYLKLGDTKLYKADVRIVAATNKNLKVESEKGHFRLDLFYRLSTFQIHLPSLNERKEDIPLLAQFFLHYFSGKLKKRIAGMDDVFVEKLKTHRWQGNVRELKNIIERGCIVAEDGLLDTRCLPFEFHFELTGNSSTFSLHEVEKQHIQKMLAYTNGNKTKTAELLGIGQTTLYAKIKEYGLL